MGLAGCGGTSTHYDAVLTRLCLEQHGAQISPDADLIAQAAVNGGYLVRVGGTAVNLSFYRTAGDASKTRDAYVPFEPAALFAEGNAVLAWDDTPTSGEKSTVDGCLTAARTG